MSDTVREMNELSRRQRANAKQQREDLIRVLTDDHGRRFIRRLLDATGVFAPTESEADQALRNFGLGLVREMNAISPLVFPKLMLQAAEERMQDEGKPRDASPETGVHYE